MHGQLDTPEGMVAHGFRHPARHGDFSPAQGMTVSLGGDNDKLRDWFAKLADGGEVSVPLEKQMWGDEFGQCTDRFGTPWMVNLARPRADPHASPRARGRRLRHVDPAWVGRPGADRQDGAGRHARLGPGHRRPATSSSPSSLRGQPSWWCTPRSTALSRGAPSRWRPRSSGVFLAWFAGQLFGARRAWRMGVMLLVAFGLGSPSLVARGDDDDRHHGDRRAGHQCRRRRPTC